ncbi:hypothetical protein ABH957_003113 [Bacillus sp. RC242]|uniref:hypothetical protein n=1 Tax=Bacillus sp. RC242 TaxID=3156286 RepID=UPI0038359B14
MNDVSALIQLLGVVVGGNNIRYSNRQRKWDEEKMRRDNHNKIEAPKIVVFSKMLYFDVIYIRLEYTLWI